nr:hypothetical protein [Nitrosomonas nitrosa]
MTVFQPFEHFARSTPTVPRNRAYETQRVSHGRRDITTQVRDWLHSKGFAESWRRYQASTVWNFNGRPALTLSITPDGYCQIVLQEWVRLEIGTCGLINSLSATWQIRSSRELKLVKPFLRLAMGLSESDWLRDVAYITERLSDHRLEKLESIFVDGITLNEERLIPVRNAA